MRVGVFVVFLMTLVWVKGKAEIQNKRVAPELIGGPCTVDDDCVGKPNSECKFDIIPICRCKDTHTPKKDLTDCLEIMHLIEDLCLEPQQCQLGNLESLSDCIDGKCQCGFNSVYVEVKKKCLQKAELIGGDCEGNEQCVADLGPEAFCNVDKCDCKSGSGSNEDGTKCLPFLDDFIKPCEEDLQCQQGTPGPESYCEDVCKCRDSAIPDVGAGICRPKASMGEVCFIDAQCQENLGDLGICELSMGSPGHCRCNDQSLPHGTKCIPKINQLGAECSVHQQCEAGIPGPWSHCSFDEVSTKRCQCQLNAVSESGGNVCFEAAPELGANCEIEEQCTESLGTLSLCFNPGPSGECQCRSGSVPSSSKKMCLPSGIPIGDGCTESNQCPVDASCSETNICQCNDRFISSSDKTKCLPYVDKVGGSCEEVPQCRLGKPGFLSDCLYDGLTRAKVCKCSDAAVDVPGHHICYEKATFVGDPCQTREQCLANLGEFSECGPSSLCKCLAGAVESSDRRSCLPGPGLIGAPCQDGNQCPENSRCTGTCECDHPGFVVNHNRDECLPVVDVIGGSCEEDIQCTSGSPGALSECNQNLEGVKVCNCTDAAVTTPGGNICYEKATEVGQFCEVLEQCTFELGPQAVCENNRCQCGPGSIVTPDRKCIEGPQLIDDKCTENFQCPDDASCVEGACRCGDNFVASINKERCLRKASSIGDICEEIQQCHQGTPGFYSECVLSGGQKRCQCTSQAVIVEGHQVCFRKANFVGDNCQHEKQCVANLGQSYCRQNQFCECLPTHLPSGNRSRCLTKADLGDDCEETIQCQVDYSSCQQDPNFGSVCKCNPNYGSPEGTNVCYRMASIVGDSCAVDDFQCSDLRGATCKNYLGQGRACHCDYDLEVVSSDRKACLKIAEGIEQPCEENGQCLGNNTACLYDGLGRKCLCKSEELIQSVVSPGNCVEIVNQLFEPCQENIQCTTGMGDMTRCHLGNCDCTTMSQPYNGNCYYPALLGMFCYAVEECIVGVSEYSYCSVKQRCECLPGSVQYGYGCWADKRVGENCATDDECRASIRGSVYCDRASFRCACFPGFVATDSGRYCESRGSLNGINIKMIIFLVSIVLLSLN